MSPSDWEDRAAEMLKGRRLHEPPETTVRRAIDIGAGLRRPGLGGRYRSYLAAAAAVVFVAAAGLLLYDPAPPLPTRGSEREARGSWLETVAPRGTIPAAPERFEWQPVEGARSYRVRLRSVTDEQLWEGETDHGSVELPAASRALLQAGVVYRWRVEALDGRGAVIARSDVEEFRLAP